MAKIIDFEQARIRLRSNVKDPVIIQDMLDNAYDPCDPEEVEQYWMREELVNALADGVYGELTQDYNFVHISDLFINDDNK
jgi:hypothetical protein